MCNSHQCTPSRTAKHVQYPHQAQGHHETSSPTGVIDVHHQMILHPDDDKEQSGAKGAGTSMPNDQQQYGCKKEPHQHAVPRSISIASSNASTTTTSAADRTGEALFNRHDSSSSLSSLSSFGSINENPLGHPQIKPSPASASPAPRKTDECRSPISPRRAIFDSYWKRSPSGPPVIKDNSKDEGGVEDPVATKPAASLPPPPPLVQVDDDATAKAFFGIVDDGPTRECQPEARRNGRLGDILEGLFGIIPPITITTTSPSTSPKPSIKSSTSPKSHLTMTGLMLAHQASCGSSSRRSTGTPPTSPQTTRPKVPLSPAASHSSASPLPSCLRQGSRRATRKHSHDDERTCDSTPLSSSEHLSHISTNHKAPVVRVRSNSTVSFCPNVHIIEFDNSQEIRDEEIIRSPRAKKEGNTEDWNAWFAV